MRLKLKLSAPQLFTFVLLSFTSCYPVTSKISRAIDQANELEKPPFAMPQQFPVPPDAQATTRPVKGTNILFTTRKTITQILDFYRQSMESQGLVEETFLSQYQDTFGQIIFKGWPGGCSLVIQVVDLAYSGPKNERSVSARLESCR